jgi:hypothetical protein
MSQYPYLKHSCQMPWNLDLYPYVETRKLKTIDVEFQVAVGYGASSNHLSDYKIYKMAIKMFFLKFLNNLWQPPTENPWPTHLTNQNDRMLFHQHCDYLLEFLGRLQNNWINLVVKVAREHFQSWRWCIWNSRTCLEHRDGSTSVN